MPLVLPGPGPVPGEWNCDDGRGGGRKEGESREKAGRRQGEIREKAI